MIKLILIISILISIASTREKPPSVWIVETDHPVAELYNPESGFFGVLGKKVKAIVEGPYVEIQSIYTFKNHLEHLAEAHFEFPQSKDDIFHKVETHQQNTVKIIFDEVNHPMKEYDRENRYTKERFLYKQIEAGSLQANETVEVIFTVMRPLKVHLNQFYELSIRPYHIPRFINLNFMHFPGNYNIQIELRSREPFKILANPTHHLQPKLSSETPILSSVPIIYKAFYNITMYNVIQFSEEFKIYFASSELNAPKTIMATNPFNPQDHVLMLSLIPDMRYFTGYDWHSRRFQEIAQPLLNSLSNPDSFLKLKTAAIQHEISYLENEYLFVVDRSDSMEGFYIEDIKKQLKILLGTLSESTSYFNILSFGSTFELYENITEEASYYKTPEETRKIMKWVETLEADMGERDLLGALKYAFEEYKWASLPKNVIILTSEGVLNAEEIIQLVQANSHSQKVCAMGVHGDGETIQKIAEAGRCPIELIPSWHNNLEERALNLMNAALIPPEFNLAYQVTCKNEQDQIIHQEEGSFDRIPKDKEFTKWFTLNNIPNLKSCKAKIFYYSKSRCFASAQEIEVFIPQSAQTNDAWHKVAEHANLLDHLELKKLLINDLLNDPQQQRSPYEIYQEQFYNLHCYDSKAPLTGIALSKPFFELARGEHEADSPSSLREEPEQENLSSTHEDREESFSSFKIVCIASVLTLLFVASLFLLF